jgi:hypothetical protein
MDTISWLFLAVKFRQMLPADALTHECYPTNEHTETRALLILLLTLPQNRNVRSLQTDFQTQSTKLTQTNTQRTRSRLQQ